MGRGKNRFRFVLSGIFIDSRLNCVQSDLATCAYVLEFRDPIRARKLRRESS